MTDMIHLPWREVGLPLHGGEGPGVLTSLLIEEAQELACLAQDACVLEVGAAAGFSTIALAQTAKSVTSVELEAGWVTNSLARSQNLAAYSIQNVTQVLGSSFSVLPSLREEGFRYDMIFLDGDHAFNSVTQDARNSLGLLTAKGVLACHDYLEDCCVDVKPALDVLFPQGPDYIIGTMAVYKT